MARDTSNVSAAAVQEKVLDAVQVSRDVTLSAVEETAGAVTNALPKVPDWVETFTAAIPRVPEWAESYMPKFPDLSVLPNYESMISLAEKIWEGQREFNLKVYETIAPIGRTAFGAAKETAKVVRPVVEKATKPAPEHTTRSAASKA